MLKKVQDFKNILREESFPFKFFDEDKEENIIYRAGLKNYFNVQYSIEIQVGSQKTPFNFILDTGSGTTLLNDIRCQSNGCNSRKGY